MKRRLKSLEMAYYNKSDQNAESHYDIYSFDTPGSKYDFFWHICLKERIEMIPMRPRYPSNKITFTIANITKGKTIRYININLNPYEKLDVYALVLKFEVVAFLEDSKRNILQFFLLLLHLT